jgi:histidine triad (HIT) family protein
MKNCLFCRIAAREVPSKVVYEDEDILAFKDINPAAPVHILVIPKKHISGITSLKEEDKEIVGKIYLAFSEIARDFSVYQCGFRIVVNSGPDANQTVDHLHFHLLGGRTLSWPPG